MVVILDSMNKKKGGLVVQKNKSGQMFKCEVKSLFVKKEGSTINLIKAPKGVLSTLADFVGCEVMITFESPQQNLDFPEENTSK